MITVISIQSVNMTRRITINNKDNESSTKGSSFNENEFTQDE